MKKLLIGILSLVLMSLLVAGCGKTDKTTAVTESKKPAEQKEFQYAMSGLYKPFNFKDNGVLTGFDVEIGQALADKMGMKAVPVTNPWETLIQALLAKKYDVILGSMSKTEERLKTVNFSNPYYRSGAQIFVGADNVTIKSAQDLKGKNIGVVKASTYKTEALKQTDPDKVKEYDSDITALMDITTGRLDAVITDQMVGFQVMKEGAMKIKDVGQPLSLDELAIAIRKEDGELLKNVNQALDDIIKDGTYDKISNKWFGRNILGKK